MYIVAFFLVAVRERPLPRDAKGKPLARPWLPHGVWRQPSWYSFCLSVFVGVFGFLPPYVGLALRSVFGQLLLSDADV